MRKNIVWVLMLVVLFQLAGCATVQKKFTRKKKEPAHKPAVIYTEEGPYQKKYSNDFYYKTHYTMWTTWHDEVLNQLGGNGKRLARAAEETMSHLNEMSHYLDPTRQAQLKPYQDSLNQICQKLSSRSHSKSDEPGIRTEMERLRRVISSNFYYDKIKDSMVTDKVDLGTDASGA